jgi:hypothetical protein
MKSTATKIAEQAPQILDIHHPDHAARLSEAYSRERHKTLTALHELSSMRYVDKAAREQTAMETMIPLPGHALMERAPREVLRLRAALFLVSCHAHRYN